MKVLELSALTALGVKKTVALTSKVLNLMNLKRKVQKSHTKCAINDLFCAIIELITGFPSYNP